MSRCSPSPSVGVSTTLFAASVLSLAVILPLSAQAEAAPSPQVEQQGPPVSGEPQQPAAGPALTGLAAEELALLFAGAGVHVDPKAGLVSIPATVEVRTELLEYLLVAPHGAVHESLFRTPVDIRLLNTALLTLGVTPGKNAVWFQKDPLPSEQELRDGASAYEIALPEGDGFYMYVGWREGDDVYFYRVEDLLRDLAGGRGMRRHAWVYLGSRMAVRGAAGKVQFAAAAEGNLVNIAFFSAGNTLLTPALEECVDQTVWIANSWLLPPSHSQVRFVFSREKLASPAKDLLSRLPEVVPLTGAGDPRAPTQPTGKKR